MLRLWRREGRARQRQLGINSSLYLRTRRSVGRLRSRSFSACRSSIDADRRFGNATAYICMLRPSVRLEGPPSPPPGGARARAKARGASGFYCANIICLRAAVNQGRGQTEVRPRPPLKFCPRIATAFYFNDSSALLILSSMSRNRVAHGSIMAKILVSVCWCSSQ